MMYLNVYCEKEKCGPGWRAILADITPEQLAAGEGCMGLHVPMLEAFHMSPYLLETAKPLPYDPHKVLTDIAKKVVDLPRQGIIPDPEYSQFVAGLANIVPVRVRTRSVPQAEAPTE